MGTGYTRNDTANNIADGNVINASDLDGEFDAIQSAFDGTTGHSHDGTTGEGPQIGTGGIADNAVTLGTKTSGNYVAAGAVSGVGLSGSASAEGATFTVTSNATDANTASTIVARDASGNFSAGTITATLSGNATTATTATTANSVAADSVALGTDTTGNYVAAGAVSGVGLSGSASAEGATFTVTSNATSANTASTIVARDASGDFSAGTITAALTGTASNAALLDSLDSTQFLRSDAADTKTSGDLSFSDNVKAIFGAGSDLQIYHNGFNSIITDLGTGDLIVYTNGAAFQVSSNDGDNMIYAAKDAGVNLYHNNNVRIQSTNDGATITGNITVSGTVDGRDVASDGSKLDGIESGATADQSASEILTLIKTVDGAGSGLDADTLDGISSGSFLRSDAADVKTSGYLLFNDNIQARFGTGSDLQIYHDGTDSYISDEGTGDLNIRASDDLRLQVNSYGSWINSIICNDAGSVDLYYNNAVKLQTTNTGIDLTGNINAVDNIYLGSALYHEGDTDTYTQFHNANEWRVVTGGTEMLEVNNDTVNLGANTIASVQVSNVASAITPNLEVYNSFVLTLTGNITLNNPSTELAGMSGVFIFIHSGAGRTVSLGTDYETVGGAGLTLSSTAGAIDIVPYFVQAPGSVLLGTPQLAFA